MHSPPRSSPLILAIRFVALAWFVTFFGISSVHAAILVIGHPSLAKLDEPTLQKVYTGKVFDVGGINVVAVNASNNNPTRARFLQSFLNQDEEKYTAYWTVRRYIGKGTPPKEFTSSSDIIQFVQSTPGAIGYIDENDAKPGLHILLKK